MLLMGAPVTVPVKKFGCDHKQGHCACVGTIAVKNDSCKHRICHRSHTSSTQFVQHF